MKRAGAEVAFDGRTLSHDDINLLGADEAFAVSVAVRRSLAADDIRMLFKQQLLASDRRWRDMNAASDGLPLQACVAEIEITGISFEAFVENMKTQTPFLADYPALHPDHFFITKRGETLQGVETFGMYGGPSEMRLSPVPDLVVPIERDETYTFAFGAVETLVDGTNANAPAFMQMKPIESGLAVKAGCCFPATAPKEMVEGHKLHLAIEFLGFATTAAAAR
ncbi:hypothetical protein [Teichococcus vastitatis]|uniref:Uncharacterized protein n=1 Tax=Teichococcus vastitatis TaxID=2307076 RepID=A0ABS9W8H9_9PROT|nr:hypothetical protein [Pseudoroseomonas vastitatis]MCI0755537.1 hypothetical protein [Pseudoroseomonas vastitatis]